MIFDDRAAADVTFKREKFREEADGEEAGIAPRAVVSESNDALAV